RGGRASRTESGRPDPAVTRVRPVAARHTGSGVCGHGVDPAVLDTTRAIHPSRVATTGPAERAAAGAGPVGTAADCDPPIVLPGRVLVPGTGQDHPAGDGPLHDGTVRGTGR